MVHLLGPGWAAEYILGQLIRDGARPSIEALDTDFGRIMQFAFEPEVQSLATGSSS